MSTRGRKPRKPPKPATPEAGSMQDVIQQLIAGKSTDEAFEMIREIAAAAGVGPRGLVNAPTPTVTIPDPPDEPLLITVRVDVDGVKPPVWRRLELRGDQTAADLHQVLQFALGWQDSHLHRFWLGPTRNIWRGPFLYTDLDEEGPDSPGAVANEEDVRLDQLVRATGDRLFYTYDFGDEWNHTIKVEAVRPATAGDPRASCTAGRNACPLEDAGGPWSHNDLVAAHRARAEYPEPFDTLVPDGWDPTEFDRDQTNVVLGLIGVSGEEAVSVLAAHVGLTPADAAALLPTQHAAVDELVSRLDPRDVTEFAALMAAALYDDIDPAEPMPPTERRAPRSVSDGLAAEVTRPWRLMLDIAGADGIPLTPAGYLKPVAVAAVAQALGIDQWWIGKVNREDLTPPVREASRLIRELGLLRRHKGRLVATPLGRTVAGNPQSLWDAVADGILDAVRPKGGRPHVESDAKVIYLAHIAAGLPMEAAMDTALRLLDGIGWQTEGSRGVSPVVVRHVLWDVRNLLGQQPFGRGDALPFTDAQRALARRALAGVT